MPFNEDTRQKEIKRNYLELLVKQLYREFDHILFTYKVKLKPVTISLKKISAYGTWDANKREIVLSMDLVKAEPWAKIVEILKHEMAHQYVHEVMKSKDCHGKDFLYACHQLRVADWARKPSLSIKDHESESPVNLTKEEEKLLRWIEKLLALAESSNEHESLQAICKVKQLCEKYNLSQIENKKTIYKSQTISHGKKRIEHYQCLIADILTSHFLVKIIYSSRFNKNLKGEEKTIVILGTEENTKLAEYVYWFLYNNIKIIWRAYCKKTQTKGIAQRNSFLKGVLNGFNQQLCLVEKDTSTNTKENNQNKSIILKKINKELDAYVHYRYPRIHTSKLTYSQNFTDSYTAGKKEGLSLRLYKGLKQKASDIKMNFIEGPKMKKEDKRESPS